MTNRTLAESYLRKCEARIEALRVLRRLQSHSDVVREAQELVELALKGILRELGVDPPRVHDVSPALLAERARLEGLVDVDALASASVHLRKHREMSFYGAEDLLPTEAYDAAEADLALAMAEQATDALRRVLGLRDGTRGS